MNPGLPDEQIFPVQRDKPATIGRTKDNTIFCLHKSLSRKHAQIEIQGGKLQVTDLQSKNGLFHNGRRVARCEVREGETFRCGDITFLVEGATVRSPATKLAGPGDRAVQTLPSPLVIGGGAIKAQQTAPLAATKLSQDEDNRYKDKLFLLIRASELVVSDLPIDRILDDLVTLLVQVLTVDRIALLTLDEQTLHIGPRVVKTFTQSGYYPYSQRVVDWVVDHGTPASFADVGRDRQLPGDATTDANVRGAMCAPLNPGGGTIGVIYCDSVSKPDCFRPDDLALLRAIANLAAVAIESSALRGVGGRMKSIVPSLRNG